MFVMFSIACLTGCSVIKEEILTENIKKIELTGILVTYQAYYRNVVEYDKKASHLFEIDRKMFIEYTGTIKYGVDLSKVKINVNGSNIIVFVPDATMIGEPNIDQENFKKENFITSRDSWMNFNPLTADDSNSALNKAQNQIREEYEKNEEILSMAKKRAKILIEENIRQLSGVSSKKFNIIFEQFF